MLHYCDVEDFTESSPSSVSILFQNHPQRYEKLDSY